MYMLYDRVMRNIENRHKRIKQMNLFINARFQRKLWKFAENPLSESRVSGLGSRVPIFGSWVSRPGSKFFFDICALSQCIVYWMNFRNIHTSTYQKTFLHKLFWLFLKSPKAFGASFSKCLTFLYLLIYLFH